MSDNEKEVLQNFIDELSEMVVDNNPTLKGVNASLSLEELESFAGNIQRFKKLLQLVPTRLRSKDWPRLKLGTHRSYHQGSHGSPKAMEPLFNATIYNTKTQAGRVMTALSRGGEKGLSSKMVAEACGLDHGATSCLLTKLYQSGRFKELVREKVKSSNSGPKYLYRIAS